MSQFKFKETMKGDALHFAFEGTIDEDAAFPAVSAEKAKTVNIDLQGIKSINSVGIREWLNWIKPIAEKCTIVFSNCPKAMVFQFNMVEGFLPKNSSVVSFYVPFYCESCDREDNVLFTVGNEIQVTSDGWKISVRSKKGPDCGDDCGLEMDVTEAKYFQFLKRKAS